MPVRIRGLEAVGRGTESYEIVVCNLKALSTVSLRCVNFRFRLNLFSFFFSEILSFWHEVLLKLHSHTSPSNCYLLLSIMLFLGYPKTSRVAPLRYTFPVFSISWFFRGFHVRHLPELVFVVWRWHLMLPCAKPMIETAEYAYFRLEQEQMFNRWRIFQAHGYQPFRFRYRWVFSCKKKPKDSASE